jgi:hypothetical protein
MRGLALGALVLALLPATAGASVLCQARRALIVREQCKTTELQVTPDRARELGLEGRQGSRGPAGPPTTDLKVLDATGGEVGVVVGTADYYGSATVVANMPLLGAGTGASPYYVLEMTKRGLREFPSCESMSVYRTPTCDGDAYFNCDYGDCGSVAGAFFASRLVRGDEATACHPGAPSQFVSGTFYFRSRAISSTPAGAAAVCLQRGGRVVGSASPCFQGLVCVPCCRVRRSDGAVPLHRVDTSALGPAPFRLGR